MLMPVDQEVAGSSPAARPQKTTPPVGRQACRLFDDIPDSKDRLTAKTAVSRLMLRLTIVSTPC